MRRLLLIAFLLLPVLLSGTVYQLNIEGPIETITEEYISDCFEKVKKAGDAKLVIIEIDTPGGFVTSTRHVIKEILGSPVPVVVYVSPRGAHAGSGGFYITISADIAAMAPGTNMGSAHPVSLTGGKIDETMKKKMANDLAAYAKSLAKSRNRNIELAEKAVRESENFTAEECLENKLIEYIANDIPDLVRQLDGKEILMVNKNKVVLELEGEEIVFLDMSTRQKFLKTITNPNLAFFLLLIGLAGLYIEFTHPGLIVPGVLGGISLLLAFLAFQMLPINYVGLFLILLSVGFFIAEVKIQGFGAFGVGGIVSFVLGAIMLIDAPIPEMRPSMTMIITFAVCFAVLFMFLAYKVFKSMERRTETGLEGMTGETGTARSEITPKSGRVFVHGEWWNAVSDETIPEGSTVVVESIDKFVLKVKKQEL
jgi:membrane-bound serine protease (ClpP class)